MSEITSFSTKVRSPRDEFNGRRALTYALALLVMRFRELAGALSLLPRYFRLTRTDESRYQPTKRFFERLSLGNRE
jgi:hypothetical protein